jgi:hypothetical protein
MANNNSKCEPQNYKIINPQYFASLKIGFT